MRGDECRNWAITLWVKEKLPELGHGSKAREEAVASLVCFFSVLSKGDERVVSRVSCL